MSNDEYLLFKAVQWALNDIPNRTLTHPIYRNTYALNGAIDRVVSRYEEEMNGIAVKEPCFMDLLNSQPGVRELMNGNATNDPRQEFRNSIVERIQGFI
jgi:hypothetical protein